jgi:hypothetical protein
MRIIIKRYKKSTINKQIDLFTNTKLNYARTDKQRQVVFLGIKLWN